MLHFYTPCKRQKTEGFLKFSGGVEMEDAHQDIHQAKNYKLKLLVFYQIFMF